MENAQKKHWVGWGIRGVVYGLPIFLILMFSDLLPLKDFESYGSGFVDNIWRIILWPVMFVFFPMGFVFMIIGFAAEFFALGVLVGWIYKKIKNRNA